MTEDIYKAEERGELNNRDSWPAYLIIGIGLLLLAANLFNFQLMNVLWPGFVIAPGLMLLWPAYSSTPEKKSAFSFLAVPGAMITITGLLLFFMNLTNHFEAWAYSWPLLWASVAWAIMYMQRFEPENSIHQSGQKFMRAMVIMFAGLLIFFELVIWNNFNPLLAIGLVGYGVYLLVKNRQNRRLKS